MKLERNMKLQLILYKIRYKQYLQRPNTDAQTVKNKDRVITKTNIDTKDWLLNSFS